MLGFELMQRYGDDAAFVSAGGYHHHIGLNSWESKGGSPPPPGTTGLFHTAIRYPTRRSLADALRRLTEAGIGLTGASDHGVSEALYLNDPDGNGVELYWDRAQEDWPQPQPGQKVAMFVRPLLRLCRVKLFSLRDWKLGRSGGWAAAALDRVAAVAPGADALADVDDVGEALALEDRGGEAAALAAAADRRDRPLAGQLVEAAGEVAVGDVEGAGDVLVGVLGVVADVEDRAAARGRRPGAPARRGRSARSCAPAAPPSRQAVIPPSRKPRTRIPTAASSSAAWRSSPSQAATTMISAPSGATRETLVAKPVS